MQWSNQIVIGLFGVVPLRMIIENRTDWHQKFEIVGLENDVVEVIVKALVANEVVVRTHLQDVGVVMLLAILCKSRKYL